MNHKELVELLAAWISDPDGAGSDLENETYREDIWLDVRGNIDLSNLANDILRAFGATS